MVSEDERRGIEADCCRLINLYANLNDAQDWQAVAALYADDATMRRPSGGYPIEGRAAIPAAFRARPPRVQRHVVANTVVEVLDRDTANAFSAIILYQGERTEDGSIPPLGTGSPLIGWYRDRLIRTERGWRFAERIGGLDFKP